MMKSLWVALVFLFLGSGSVEAADRPNVLLICIDDLRPVLGCYGGAARTPNLDRFAESAVTFQRHYVQFPSCGPSRASMFGGVRPDTLRLYGNGGAASVANDPENRPTMPLYFRNNGYTTLSFGKTYHSKGWGPGFGWSRPPWHPPSGWTCYVNFKAPKGKSRKGSWRPAFEIYDGPDNLHGDYQTADQAIKAIEENKDKPFFIVAGFYKPHLPFVAPKRFWDLYKDEEIKPLEPRDIPQGAQHYQYSFREICAYGLQKGKLFTPESMPTESQAGDLVHAYYAAASFADAQAGRILKKLDELKLQENTIVIVWSDHGFHLGDQKRWAKWTQFEADMRSPLMIRAPMIGQGGRHTNALVESVDIYPTLAAACGLKLPSHLEGVSLLPIINRQADSLKPAAYSQVKGLKNHPNMLAYSLRTDRHRYIEWRDVSDGFNLVNTELYDLGIIGAERTNLADDPEQTEVLEACQTLMGAGYSTLLKVE
ncbi:MAG: sulfatase [Fuerstiella sp.]|nr:sulfatase [Fuerstiella sp.]MCP4854151.1 sulfatase [Fuerstiella sp.]